VTRESLIGSTVAGYRLLDEVGEGGTSSVFKAEHPSHGIVALKILRPKLREDRTAVARFVREAQYGARVIHPNVVRTIEIGQAENGLHFLAIEWATGQILDKYAKAKAPLEPGEVAAIITQIAEAVQAAHQANIVHRDHKPENIMYDPESKRIKLLDFGIAADTQASADERLTRAGFFVGSLMYVAPEALSGELVSSAADQYSLATIAYYLLTRCLPYTAKSPREMFTQLLSTEPVPLNEAKEKLEFHPELEAVVMRALSKKPEKRFAGVLEFAENFTAATNLPPVQSGLFSRVKGILRRKP
jgi:serine/threonine-protein kinase